MGFGLGVVRSFWTDLRGPLYRNAVYLMANTAVGLATGFFFWVIVGQLYPAEDVGRAAAAISILGFLGGLANLGLGIGIVRYLPEAGKRGAGTLNTCLTIGGAVGLLLAVVFLLGLDLWAERLFFLRADPLFLVTFIIAGGLMAVAPTLDGALVAKRRAEFVMFRQASHAVRLPLPILLAPFLGAFGIFGSWSLAVLVGILVGTFWFVPKVMKDYRLRPRLRGHLVGRLFRFSFGNYAASVIGLAPIGLLPVLILNVLDETAAGQFFVAYSMATLLFVIPGAMSMSLFAEGSQQVSQFRRDVRKAVQLISLLLVPAILVLYFFGDLVLRVYGNAYSPEGFRLLQLLALSGGFVAINSLYVAKLRVDERLVPIVVLAAIVAGITLAWSFVLLPDIGIPAVGVAQIMAQGTATAYCGLDWVYSRRRRPRKASAEPPKD